MAAIVPFSTRRIARLAGVSHMTVARVLHNDPLVRPATSARVRKFIEQCGYRPHPMVSALMTQLQASRRTRFQPTVAYLNTWWPPAVWHSCPTKTAQFAGAKARAEELGYKLEMFWFFAPGVTPGRIVQILRTRRIQGVLIGPIQYSWKKFPFAWDEFSLATISFSMRDPELTNAGAAIFHGMSRVMAELRARGYRRIGYITSRNFERRGSTLAGGAFRLYQHEFPTADRIEPLIFDDAEINPKELAAWLRARRPDAVVTRLQDVFEHLGKLGLRLPRDLGFAHIDLSPALISAGVSGIDQLHRLVGAAAVETVINQMNNNVRGVPKVPSTLFIYGEFVEGKTLRKLPKRSALGHDHYSRHAILNLNRFA